MRLVDSELLEKSKKFEPGPASALSPAMVLRAREMEPSDQLFLELALDVNHTHRDVARVVGCSTGTVSRRLRTLMNRLRDPLVVALFDRRLPLPQDYREIGIDHFLRGRTSREIAELRGLTRFQVSQLIHFMRSWFKGLCANHRFYTMK